MARFILFVFFAATIFIVGINFVVGLVRRLFGFAPPIAKKTVNSSESAKSKQIYNHDGTVVYQGKVGMVNSADIPLADETPSEP